MKTITEYLKEDEVLEEAKVHPLMGDLAKAVKLIDKVRRGKTKIEDDVILNKFRDDCEATRDYIEEMLDYVEDLK